MKRVFLGISGGIDSFISALILKEQGYEVVGVHLVMEKTYAEDTASISRQLGIDIITHDVSALFDETVVKPFISSYLAGETPSPCAVCNPEVKWHALAEVADINGGGLIATGHYCRIVEKEGLFFIRKGVDTQKEQSYYLWRLGQPIISRALFPLGDMTKAAVREYALKRGSTAINKRRESMGVCFLRGKTLKTFLAEHAPSLKTLSTGDIVAPDGSVIGKHEGYPFYTLAQRKGLDLPVEMCVTGVDKYNNRVFIGNKNSLFTTELKLKNLFITSEKMLKERKQLSARVRGIGLNPSGYAKIDLKKESATLRLEYPAWAVAAGQPVVLYDNDIVLGGGFFI